MRRYFHFDVNRRRYKIPQNPVRTVAHTVYFLTSTTIFMKSMSDKNWDTRLLSFEEKRSCSFSRDCCRTESHIWFRARWDDAIAPVSLIFPFSLSLRSIDDSKRNPISLTCQQLFLEDRGWDGSWGVAKGFVRCSCEKKRTNYFLSGEMKSFLIWQSWVRLLCLSFPFLWVPWCQVAA